MSVTFKGIKGDSNFIRSLETWGRSYANNAAAFNRLYRLSTPVSDPSPSSWNMPVSPTDFSGNFSGGRARIYETVRASARNHVRKLISLAEECESARAACELRLSVENVLRNSYGQSRTCLGQRGRAISIAEMFRELREIASRSSANVSSSRMSLINIIHDEFTSSFAISIKPLVKSSAVYNEPESLLHVDSFYTIWIWDQIYKLCYTHIMQRWKNIFYFIL